MYRDIGGRQHQGVMTNGHKFVEKLRTIEDAPYVGSTMARDIANMYERRLKELEDLFRMINKAVNFND